VTLRDGVKFHNGETLTADYVVFTFSPERLTGETAPLPYGRSYFALNR
jgi:peptide/nickel transport system substrate-binding protein